MSQFKEIEVGGSVYFWFAANGTDGDAGDGATPLYDVRLAGAAAAAIPTASGTPTLLTHANYGAGLHEIAIDTTGYAEGEYAVFCSLTISTVNPGGFVGSFVVRATSGSLGARVDALIATVGTAGAGLTNINLPNQTMDIVGNITGNLSGTVGSVTGAVGSVTAGVTLADGAHGGAAATLTFKKLTGANADAGGSVIELTATGTGNSHGLLINATNGKAMALGSTNNDAVSMDSSAAKGLNINGATAGIDADITGSLSGSVGSVTGAVGSVTGAVGSVTGAVTVGTNSDKTGYALSSAGVQAIWDALTSAMVTVGSIGKKLADWVVGTIDTYTGNTKQTGDVFPLASTEIADIKAKTDSLTFTVAGQVDANVQRINDVAVTGDGSAIDKFDVV